MKRATRFIILAILPPALGATIALLVAGFSDGFDYVLGKAKFLYVYSYLLGLVPSTIYAGVMDWYYHRRAGAHTWRAVRFSSALGGLAGVVISTPMLVWMPALANGILLALYLGAIGAAVGFFLGWCAKLLAPIPTLAGDVKPAAKMEPMS